MTDDRDSPVELLGPVDPETSWEKSVWERCRSQCSNCGETDHLKARMVVPREAGGQFSPLNGVLVCRSCEMAAESVGRNEGPARRPINFWVSRRMHDRLKNGIRTRAGFTSMGSLVRYLMSKYVADEPRFDDLEQHQDEGTDVKVNVWVEEDRYETFKQLVTKRGLTVTGAVKALVSLYESKAEQSLDLKEKG